MVGLFYKISILKLIIGTSYRMVSSAIWNIFFKFLILYFCLLFHEPLGEQKYEKQEKYDILLERHAITSLSLAVKICTVIQCNFLI